MPRLKHPRAPSSERTITLLRAGLDGPTGDTTARPHAMADRARFQHMSTYARIADLPLEIESVELPRQEQSVSSGFTRVSTEIVLRGRGETGRGEDVCYTATDHDLYPPLDRLVGSHSIDSLSRLLDETELFTGEPAMPASHDYRRWAIESSALDLALRQAGTDLGGVLALEAAPVRFCVSTRLDARDWLAIDPSLEFKVDPVGDWDRSYVEALAATGRVRVLDFKAFYVGTAVDNPFDHGFYRLIAETFPDAVLEDPSIADDALAALADCRDRISFDAPIHSLADVDALPLRVKHLNIKPSRFGTLARLFECIDACHERGISMYGGGQFELGVGRSQIQELASLFYPATANDVAPIAYNAPEPVAGLPGSPLAPPAARSGFGGA